MSFEVHFYLHFSLLPTISQNIFIVNIRMMLTDIFRHKEVILQIIFRFSSSMVFVTMLQVN